MKSPAPLKGRSRRGCSDSHISTATGLCPVLLAGVWHVAPVAAQELDGEAPGVNQYWYARAEAIARKYGLGDVFLRQIMQESGFADDVITGQRVSWAGAQGIAQIMVSYHPYVNPLDPEAALDYAARHMLDLLLRFDGSVSKALAAYNAGAGTVEWAVEIGGDQWLPWMPLETQEYVAIIVLDGEPDRIAKWPRLRYQWLLSARWFERPLQLETTESRKLLDALTKTAEAAAAERAAAEAAAAAQTAAPVQS